MKIFLLTLPLFAIISCVPVSENTQLTKTEISSQATTQQAVDTPEPVPTISSSLEPTVEQATAVPTLPTATTLPATASVPAVSDTATPAEAAATNSASNADLATEGLRVYKEQYCGLCHELDVASTKGLFGPSHNQVALNAALHVAAADYGGKATDPAGYIRESILEPGVHLVEGFELSSHKMPAYTHLSEEDVEALVQFLLQQK